MAKGYVTRGHFGRNHAADRCARCENMHKIYSEFRILRYWDVIPLTCLVSPAQSRNRMQAIPVLHRCRLRRSVG